MDKRKLENDIFELALPIAQGLNCELVGVEFIKDDGEWYLRIYIDKEDGINIDDCAAVSRVLDKKLDEVDPIEYQYYLEVSSPGPNRLIVRDQDFIKFAENTVKIKFIKPFEGKKHLLGTLKGIDGEDILIHANEKEYRINKNTTSYVKLNNN
jgi:ribosome maturation factor RimP